MWIDCKLELPVIKILPGNNCLPLSVVFSSNFELLLDGICWITDSVTAF